VATQPQLANKLTVTAPAPWHKLQKLSQAV